MALTESIEVLRAAARGYLAGMEAADAACDVFDLDSVLYQYSDDVILYFYQALGGDEDGPRVLRVRAEPTSPSQSDDDVLVLELREDEV